MKFVSVVVVGGLVGSLLGVGIAPPAASAVTADPQGYVRPYVADGSWALTGTMEAPARSAATSVTVTLSGSIEVTQGVLNAAACDDTVARPPQAVVQLRNTTTSAYTSFGSGVPVITSAGSTSVSGSVSVPPASYELTLRYRCGSSEALRGQLSASPPVTVRTATLVEARNLTLACLAASTSACPSTATATLGVPSGYSVRIGAISRLTWSDGVVTEETPSGSQRLESSTSGSFWSGAGSSCSTTVTVTSSLRYRCVVGSTNFNDVLVNRLEPTSIYEIGTPTVQPAAALADTSASITASITRQFSDGSKWPAPSGTTYVVEFQSLTGFSWSQVGSSRTTTRDGTIDAPYTITESGRVRLRTGSYSSPATEVTVLTRTGKYQLTRTTGPGTANPGSSVSISATVQEELSNGSPAPAGNGVSIDLEFAIAYSADDSRLVWTKVSSGTTSNGTVTATSTAQYSGMWRFKKDDRTSPPVFVTVPGSAPITASGTVVPLATETPFVGTSTRYTVTASLSGYVGTENLQLFASIGGAGWVSVGTFAGRTQIMGVYSLPNPGQWGETAPLFEVRDPRGLVVGSGTAPAVFVDGVRGYLPKLSASPRLYLPGETVRFTATLVAVTHLDKERPAAWSGSVELQRWDGTAWRPVRVVVSARGSQVIMDGEAVADAPYRVSSTFAQAASDPINLRVTRGAPELKVGWPDTVRVSQGLRVTAFLQLSEGERWTGTSRIQMQYRAPNARQWVVKSRKTMTAGRTVTMTAERPSSGCYRVVLPDFGIESYAGYGVKSCRADLS